MTPTPNPALVAGLKTSVALCKQDKLSDSPVLSRYSEYSGLQSLPCYLVSPCRDSKVTKENAWLSLQDTEHMQEHVRKDICLPNLIFVDVRMGHDLPRLTPNPGLGRLDYRGIGRKTNGHQIGSIFYPDR
jgi:hypothetical protein